MASDDCSVMTWLLSSMHEKVSASGMFINICDTMKEIYSSEQHISRVANVYEKLFSLQHDSHFIFDY